MDTEDELEVGSSAELTIQFLVSDLTLKEQNDFVQRMELYGFGIPSEGVYSQISPPKLAEPLARIATFTFSVILGSENAEDTLDLAVTEQMRAVVFVAKTHRVRLLSASSDVKKDIAA